MASAPPLDPAIVSSERPSAVYSRAQLLALYTSPLVPNKLEGMKELSEWHGEVLPPPSPPQSRSSLRPGQGERSTSDRNSRRLQHAADSSPFANFGRFGVDGGLGGAGDLLESPGAGRNNRRTKGGLGGVEVDKDAAPHLLGREPRTGLSALQSGGGDRDRLGDRLSRTRGSGLEREDGLQRRGGGTDLEPNNRRRTAANGSTGGLGADALESTSRRDARRGLGPADEGGWRNVGATREDRDRRLARNGGPAGTDSPSSASRREGTGFGARTNGRPAWMDEDSASSPGRGHGTSGSSPAWMDAPATGKMSFDAEGNARESSSPDEDRRRKDKRSAGGGASSSARELETYNPGAAAAAAAASGGGGAGANGGMDAMQAFKAQMKERERRERERDLRARGLPVETDEPAAAAAAPTPSKSIFEDLGISRAPPGLGSPSPAAREVGGGGDEGGDQGARGGGGGGRSSRFAKFFDGKPVPLNANETAAGAAPTSTASVFGSLIGGSSPATAAVSSGPPPSKEDSDSMARLLGMLQVSGQRATSPNVMSEAPAMSPPPPPQQRSAADLARALSPQVQASSQPQPQRTEDGSNDAASGRSRSRFAFSHNQKDAPSPAAPQHPGLPNLQSPFAAASPLPPPPGLASPMRSRAPTEASTADSLPSPRAARSEQGPTMSPLASGMSPSHGSFSPPTGLQQQQPGPQGKAPPAQQPQMPYFGQGPPPPPPFAHGPPVGPDGRFLAHQMPLPGPNQLPPNMPPPFAFGPDGRPIPLPPNLGFASPPPPPFGGANGMPPRNFGGPLSPPLVSPPVGSSPAQMRGQPAQFPFPPGPPPPSHMFQQAPHHFAPGRMPLPPPNAGQGPPPPMMNLGGNAGADLMALLNSGSGGQRIGANGPPNGVQVRQG